MTTNITTTTDTTTVVVEENIVRIELNNVGVQGTPGLSGVVAVTSPITNSGSAGSAIVGINQALLSITKSQVSDFTSGTVTSASTAQQSGTAVYSVNSGTAVYATTSGTAVSISGSITKSQVSDFTSGTVTSASTAQQSGTAVYATTSGTADFATNASTAVNVSGSAITRSQVSDFTSGTVASAGTAQQAGTAVYATTSGTAVFATTSGTAVFATTSGTAVNISGTVTQSQVTNLVSDLALKAPLASPTFSGTVTLPFTNSGIVHSGTAGVMQVSAAAPGLGYIPYTASVTGLYSWLDLGVVAREDQANAFTVGGHVITNAATAVIPLVVRGALNQSANLQEWQSSAGGTVALVSAAGLFTPTAIRQTGSGNLNSFGGAAVTGQIVSIFTGGTANKGLVVQGAASQTASLMEMQTSDAVVRARFTSTGSLRIGGEIGSVGLAVNMDFIGPGGVGAIIRGAASQSANLQEWQSSAATILARVLSDGSIFSPSFTTTNGRVAIGENTSGGTLRLERATGAQTNPGANLARIYFRDGTNAGTLKLVVRAGAAGAETTVLDNIPQ
jgi:hypothetical protein